MRKRVKIPRLNQDSLEKQNQQLVAGRGEKESERQREMYFIYIYGEKETHSRNVLAHTVVRTDKFEIHRAGQQAANSQKGVDAAVLRKNFFFLRETSLLLLRPSD